MNCVIPFTKDIQFKTTIASIISVSLEHEYTINDDEILGNFIITGEYKTHEVSINKEKFEYVLPFSVNLTKDVDRSALDFNIENFTYEIVENNTLRVNIEYSINAPETRENLFEPVEDCDENLETLLDDLDHEEIAETTSERNDELEADEKEETLEIKEKNFKNVNEEAKECEDKMEEKTTRNIDEEAKTTIIESINNDEESFVTYHIHIMKENDSLESICIKYNTTENVLKEYNDLTNIALGDKIIIPDNYE